jgi:hypothetical protein
MTRPRAADDFAAIRARMEELRRERAMASTVQQRRLPVGKLPYHHAADAEAKHEDRRLLPRLIHQRLLG